MKTVWSWKESFGDFVQQCFKLLCFNFQTVTPNGCQEIIVFMSVQKDSGHPVKLGDNLALWTNDFAFSEKSYACIMQEALFWSQQAQFRSSVAFFHQVSYQQMKHLTSWLDFTFKRQRQIELLQKVAKNDTKKFFLET